MKKNSFNSGYKKYDTSEGYGNARQWRSAFKERMTGEEAQSILDEQELTPWAILNLKPGATIAQIKKAYWELLQIWHPDKHPNDVANATAITQKIIAAYTILNPKIKIKK